MTDEELGFEIWKRTNCVEPNVTMHEIMGRAARELLAKPVATRKEVAHWVADGQYGKHTLTDLVFSALSHFAPPAPEVDADAGAKALAFAYLKNTTRVGDWSADQHWEELPELSRNGWRAVAAAKKEAGGE